MSELKVGDRVRILVLSNKGKLGTIDERRWNKNMAVYGQGDEILVKVDGYGDSRFICMPEDLELVTS